MSRDESALIDITRAAWTITSFVEGMTKESFLPDVKTQSAVMHQLMVLGEAVKRLSEEFRAQHVSIPWRLIAGMRDQLIHRYDVVDLDEVWRTVVEDVPRLLSQLAPLVPPEPNDS